MQISYIIKNIHRKKFIITDESSGEEYFIKDSARYMQQIVVQHNRLTKFKINCLNSVA